MRWRAVLVAAVVLIPACTDGGGDSTEKAPATTTTSVNGGDASGLDLTPASPSEDAEARRRAQVAAEQRKAAEQRRQPAQDDGDRTYSTAAKTLNRELSIGSLLTDVRVGSHDGFDRIVFEFEGEVPPALATYAPAPASGECVRPDVDGPVFLNLMLRTSTTEPVEGGFRTTYDGPFRLEPAAPALNSLVLACDFEAQVAAVASVDRQRPFAMYVLDSPGRLVVDLATT